VDPDFEFKKTLSYSKPHREEFRQRLADEIIDGARSENTRDDAEDYLNYCFYKIEPEGGEE
jgi:hypothetical protein